jgi:hypothetical protein
MSHTEDTEPKRAAQMIRERVERGLELWEEPP